jgi:hypothetical protein
MAQKVEFELVVKTNDSVKEVEQLNKKVKEVEKSSRKTNKELSGGAQIGKEAIRGLDRQTSGLATKLVAVGKAAKLSGKAMKTALISSGIGLAVVALGLIVEHWDKIGEALGFINKDLEKQADQLNKNIALNDQQLQSLDNQEQILILQGKSTGRIKEDKKSILLLQQEENKLLLENYQTQLLREQQQQLELDWWDKLKIAAASATGVIGGGVTAYAASFEKSAEEIEKLEKIQKLISDAKTRDEQLTIKLLQIEKKAADEKIKSSDDLLKKTEEAEKEKEAAIERIRKGLIDTEAEERAEKLRLIKKDYDQQIALAAEFYGTNSIKILELKAAQKLAEDEQQALFDEQDKERKDKKREEARQRDADSLEAQIKLNEQIEEAEIGLQEAKADALRGGLDVLGQLAGKSKALSIGLLVVEKGLAIAEVITNASKAIAAAKANLAATPAAIGVIPNPMYAIQAAATVKGILSAKLSAAASIATIAAQAIPGGGGGGGGSTSSLSGGTDGRGAAPAPPSFNVVGSSGTNQLASAIGGQSQQPVKAFVVSNDVTTSQELERNIISNASIG